MDSSWMLLWLSGCLSDLGTTLCYINSIFQLVLSLYILLNIYFALTCLFSIVVLSLDLFKTLISDFILGRLCFTSLTYDVAFLILLLRLACSLFLTICSIIINNRLIWFKFFTNSWSNGIFSFNIVVWSCLYFYQPSNLILIWHVLSHFWISSWYCRSDLTSILAIVNDLISYFITLNVTFVCVYFGVGCIMTIWR